MNSFTLLFIAVQACLFQNVYGQCLRGAAAPVARCRDSAIAAPLGYKGAYGRYGFDGLAYDGLGYAGRGVGGGGYGGYGGVGIGNVAVAGELPVAGTTVVAGQVPVIGAVEFGGPACAAGTVSIAGSCGCGCSTPYIY